MYKLSVDYFHLLFHNKFSRLKKKFEFSCKYKILIREPSTLTAPKPFSM
jgi:hypothetical protein